MVKLLINFYFKLTHFPKRFTYKYKLISLKKLQDAWEITDNEAILLYTEPGLQQQNREQNA